ncbi:MAG: phospholipid carrier-dependent glycosyltransferase [Actinomycetota bacterium]
MSRLVRFINRPVVAILAVGLLAGGLHFWHLSSPHERIFDEVYYPKAGCILIGGSNAQCGVDSTDEKYWRRHKWDVGSWTHPPLGKWMIGLGEKAFGFDTFGWRVSAAVVGTLTVMAVATIALLLFGEALWAFVAGLLLSIEGLSFVMARTGLLDTFIAFWVTLGFLFLLLDRRWIEQRTPSEEGEEEGAPTPARPPSPLWRPWRLAAGAALGAAIATKWSGVVALAAAVLLSVTWETVRRRRGQVGGWRAFAGTLARESLGIVVAFLLLPVIVYVATYLPWFHHFGWSLGTWWENQVAIWDYHRDLQWYQSAGHGAMTPTHPWLSHAWTWLSMQRPVLFYARYPGDDTVWITTIGNPTIFWGALWTLPYTAYAWRRHRDWRAGFILIAFAVQYLPWFFVSRPQFFFYMTPMVPFLVLAAVYSARDLADMRIEQRDPYTHAVVERSTLHPYRPFVWVYVGLAIALFIFFFPVLTADQLSKTAWQLRVWLPGWT